MQVPKILNKDEAFTTMAQSICDTVGYSLQRTTEIAAETWQVVGGEIRDYLTQFPDETLNSLVSDVRKIIKAELGWSPGRSTLYEAVKFHEALIVHDNTVDEVIEQHGSWRKIRTLYLKEGGGCNNKDEAPETGAILTPPSPPSSYEDTLKGPCPICGGWPCEKAHYPTTIGAGAEEDEWIPLCHTCHIGEMHVVGFTTWFHNNGRKLFKNFIYPMMRREK